MNFLMKIDWGIVTILLIVTVPVLATIGLYFWSNRKDKKDTQMGTRFTNRTEITILIIGIFLLLILI
ncbi:MAG: hypothetical protein A2X93_00015 [Deltaproteobacteria bacterium GWC2_56_8]|nr:MAG: hypothetical protein A2X93_00015 [Deltaproteobacteria bacterium GWC2_56_8]